MKIGILGTPVDCGNRGVLALGASLVNLCWHQSKDCEVVLLLGNQDDQPAMFRLGAETRLVPIVPVRLSPRSHPRYHLFWVLSASVLYRLLPLSAVRRWLARSTPWVAVLEQCRFVGDVRGGDSFSDIYGMSRFLTGCALAWSVILVRGSMVQFPQTFGPYKSPVARSLGRYILRRSSVIIARDKESQKVAQDLVGLGQRVLLSPDVAFSLDAVVPSCIELNPALSPSSQLLTLKSGVIGLNVNGLMYNGGYTRDNMFGLKLNYPEFLRQLVESLLQVHPGEIWLIPHTFAPDGTVESDPEASRKLRDSLPESLRQRVRIVNKDYDQHEIKGVIGRCDFFIGSRMHACIAALSQGIPCVGVAYSMKFAGVFESVGMADWVLDGRACAGQQAVTRILELFHRRDVVRAPLSLRAQQARKQLAQIFMDLFSNAAVGRGMTR